MNAGACEYFKASVKPLITVNITNYYMKLSKKAKYIQTAVKIS